jgi:hypothetical protein
MEPSQPPNTAGAATAKATYDFSVGQGRKFVRDLLRELRTTHNDLYTLVVRGYIVSPVSGLTIISDPSDIPLLKSDRLAAVDDAALPTMTPTQERKKKTLSQEDKDAYRVSPAIIDQADDRLAVILLSRITSTSGVALLERLGSDGRAMLKACSERDKLPSGISSLSVRARLDAIQSAGITEQSLARPTHGHLGVTYGHLRSRFGWYADLAKRTVQQ